MVTLSEQLPVNHVRVAQSVTMVPLHVNVRVLTENTWLILAAVSVRLATSQLMDLLATMMATLIVSVLSTNNAHQAKLETLTLSVRTRKTAPRPVMESQEEFPWTLESVSAKM